MTARKLTPRMVAALAIAVGRKSGIVGVGTRHSDRDTDPSTLRALRKRGLLVHIGSGGPYYAHWSQYRITDAGRLAFALRCSQ